LSMQILAQQIERLKGVRLEIAQLITAADRRTAGGSRDTSQSAAKRLTGRPARRAGR
jgi:hypothetical protein